MEYRKIGNTDMNVACLSFGCSSIGGVFKDIKLDECIKTVHTAIEMGMNYLDTSPYYGNTLSEINTGKALKGINRDKYYIASKAGKYSDDMDGYDFSYDRIIQSCDKSLQRLGLEYLDVLQLHDFEYHGRIHVKQAIEEGIPALKELKKQGKIRYTGITAYPLDVFKTAIDKAHVDLILSHNRYSLNDHTLLDITPYLKNNKVGIISASPLSSGLLTKRGVPSWHPANEDDRKVIEKAIKLCKDNNVELESIAIKFSIQNPDIATTLISSSNPDRIKQSIIWANEPYDKELTDAVLKILEPINNKDWGWGD